MTLTAADTFKLSYARRRKRELLYVKNTPKREQAERAAARKAEAAERRESRRQEHEALLRTAEELVRLAVGGAVFNAKERRGLERVLERLRRVRGR